MHAQTKAAGLDVGAPPDPIGIDWILFTAERLTEDRDDDEAGEDDDFDGVPGLSIQVI